MLAAIRDHITARLGELEIRARDGGDDESIEDVVVVGGRITTVLDFGEHMIIGLDDGTGAAQCHLVAPIAEKFRPHATVGNLAVFEGRVVSTCQARGFYHIYTISFISNQELVGNTTS